MNLSEKAAYIKGRADGLELDTDKKEVRVIKEMLELLGEMASDVEDIGADLTDLYDAVEEIDEDLGNVEEELFGEGMDHFDDEGYEVTCHNCEEPFMQDEDVLIDGDVVCPH